MKFKYEIGDKTNRGIVKSRYYGEWKNRNGGDACGIFYEFEDGESFNEILVSKESINLETNKEEQMSTMEQKVLVTETKTTEENKTTMSQRVSIEIPKPNGYNQYIHIKREDGVTTISLTEDEEYEKELTKFEATVEDEKLKTALSYIGGMVFKLGANVLKDYINHQLEQQKKAPNFEE